MDFTLNGKYSKYYYKNLIGDIIMSQEHLNNFLSNTVLSEGYSVEFRTLSTSDLNKMVSLAQAVLNQPSEEDINKKKVKILLYDLSCIVNHPLLDWEDKYVECWVIAGHIRDYTEVDWCDPDTSYEEDVMAYYNAAKQHIGEL